MVDDAALEALEEIRDQVNPSISTELLRQLMRVEVLRAFDERPEIALREVDAVIDTYLRGSTTT
jgi:hypothetical protein